MADAREGAAAWLRAFSAEIDQQAAHLTELDSAIGDADHGSNMNRGMKAVVAAVDDGEFATAADLFKKAGMTLVSTVGGASGPLYGTFFLRFAGAFDEDSDASVTPAGFGAALHAGVEGVLARGKAEREDKTMYDALAPALEAYDAAVEAGKTLDEALGAAAGAAAEGRDATEPMVARKGRASYLGERSAGHVDPGAASATILLETAVGSFT